MSFQFDSLQDFIQMSGHGPFVWACYGITFAVLVYLVFSPLVRRRRLIRQHQAWLKQMDRVREVARQA
ncbi:heme exporter protein CcmD [Marinimicrobium sp. ABcell2]|uniref:heme exporter protein CcmD n=1 Tax=Marinimicrobium sp. ABcell2 TaxID=3069751 RepID=UPI0027B59C9D|nr:heme exporter protein CcmD [Marinimicrobium sp. ABcell2]MDQ2077846.1 heme exporter protein CcmD [Marinimicrobium sp. ABcell2]